MDAERGDVNVVEIRSIQGEVFLIPEPIDGNSLLVPFYKHSAPLVAFEPENLNKQNTMLEGLSLLNVFQ